MHQTFKMALDVNLHYKQSIGFSFQEQVIISSQVAPFTRLHVGPTNPLMHTGVRKIETLKITPDGKKKRRSTKSSPEPLFLGPIYNWYISFAIIQFPGLPSFEKDFPTPIISTSRDVTHP